MAKRCRIRIELRGKIVIFFEEGYTQRQIAARIVCKVLKKNKLLGSVVNKNILGKKRKKYFHEDRLIVRKCKSNQYKTAPEIQTEVREEYVI